MRATDALEHLHAEVPPASGAIVMGTGIVSVALLLDHHKTLSRILLVVASVFWVALALLLADRIARDRPRVRREARSPAALTGVAGTAVLGTRLLTLGWDGVSGAMLLIALLLWLAVVPRVLAHWAIPTVGVSLMLSVATESLAALAAMLAATDHATWLLYAALAPFLLGLCLYAYVIARFDLRQLVAGRGDHWITGGALAISALAAGLITLAARDLHQLVGLGGALKTISFVLWAITMAWLPALLVAEAVRPRLGYELRRWSTVFPLGMYAACSFVVGTVGGAAPITDFARVWVWVAAAGWLAAFAAMLSRAARLGR
jgi:hypothetical protein